MQQNNDDGGLTIYRSRFKMGFLLTGNLVLTAFFIFLAYGVWSDEDAEGKLLFAKVFSTCTALLFIFMTYMMSSQMIFPKPALKIERRGVTIYSKFFPWSEIEDVRVDYVRTGKLLVFQKVNKNTNPGWLSRIWHALFSTSCVPESILPMSADELASIANNYREGKVLVQEDNRIPPLYEDGPPRPTPEQVVENARLAPLVSLAYSIYREEIPLSKPPDLPKKPGTAANAEFTFESYAAGVREEIDRDYTFPSHGRALLFERAADGSLGKFTEADCLAAIKLFNEFLQTALLLESRYGDTNSAVDELKEQYPRLDKNIYDRIIGWLGYKNR